MTPRQALKTARRLIKQYPLPGGRSITVEASATLDEACISWRVRPASDSGILLGVFEWAYDRDLRNGTARWRPL